MSQTTPDSADLAATGTILAAGAGMIVLGLPGTEYQLHLETAAPIAGGPNTPIRGRVLARVRRIDRVTRGGRFIEPIYGRPRRVQGAVVDADHAARTLTVRAGGGCPFVCSIDAGLETAGLEIGTLVGVDVERGASFEPLT